MDADLDTDADTDTEMTTHNGGCRKGCHICLRGEHCYQTDGMWGKGYFLYQVKRWGERAAWNIEPVHLK